MDGWTNGWMDEWTDGWMDGWNPCTRRRAHNVSAVRFGLAFVQRVLVEDPSGVELGGPDELLVVEQGVHADDAGVVLDVGEQLVAAALVEGMHEAADLGVVGQVEHPLLRPCQATAETTSKRHATPSGTMSPGWTAPGGGVAGKTLTFGHAAPADLLVIAVAGALERSFGVGAVMRTRVKLKTLINLWKEKEYKVLLRRRLPAEI